MQEDHRDPRAGRAGPGTGWAALGAAAVMLALTVWGRGIALTLAGVLVGPVPALKTAFTLLTGPEADSAPASSAAASPRRREAFPAALPFLPGSFPHPLLPRFRPPLPPCAPLPGVMQPIA